MKVVVTDVGFTNREVDGPFYCHVAYFEKVPVTEVFALRVGLIRAMQVSFPSAAHHRKKEG